ncbi:uncharacterized protein LOC125482226 [Rhincodon typus]|uniref:uncharacterized protein LOC125482226 n=1 Tax=Rhincodon typus TaxID=259920 RepID=UPI00202E9B8C|nr:uncharacterized protein LOC125482226 [Rhincodon typus]
MQGENVVHCLATGFGNTYISTFTEIQFEFRGHCSYVLLRDNSDPQGFSILLDQKKDCLKGKCTRKIIFSKGNIPVLELLTIADFLQQYGMSLPMIYNGMYIYGTQQELFIKINKGLTVLWNGKGTITVSMKKPIDVTGLCSHSGEVIGHTVAAMWELKDIGMPCSTTPAEDYQNCQLAKDCIDKGRHHSCSLQTLNILQRACRNDVCCLECPCYLNGSVYRPGDKIPSLLPTKHQEWDVKYNFTGSQNSYGAEDQDHEFVKGNLQEDFRNCTFELFSLERSLREDLIEVLKLMSVWIE